MYDVVLEETHGGSQGVSCMVFHRGSSASLRGILWVSNPRLSRVHGLCLRCMFSWALLLRCQSSLGRVLAWSVSE